MRLGKTLLSLALAGGLLLTQGVGAAASEPTGFSDVDEADWYAGAVAYVRENGLMSGVSDTAFAPGAAMTAYAVLRTVPSALYSSDRCAGCSRTGAARLWACPRPACALLSSVSQNRKRANG